MRGFASALAAVSADLDDRNRYGSVASIVARVCRGWLGAPQHRRLV